MRFSDSLYLVGSTTLLRLRTSDTVEMLNISKINKVLSILFGGLKYSSYFCTSKFDKFDKIFNKYHH